MKILGIDTSGKVASVAISDGEKLLWEKSVFTTLTHSQVILPMVEQALKDTALDLPDIDCAAVACGPGSYTGLRIGIGALKGMAMGCESLKCAGVSTLLSLALNCLCFKGKIIAVMRARPDISYVGEFESDGCTLKRTGDDRVAGDYDTFENLDTSQGVMLVGDNAEIIKQKFFSNDNNVTLAPMPLRLQRAGSLCLAVQTGITPLTGADKLEVSYLQATKAEKDKAHSGEQEETK